MVNSGVRGPLRLVLFSALYPVACLGQTGTSISLPLRPIPIDVSGGALRLNVGGAAEWSLGVMVDPATPGELWAGRVETAPGQPLQGMSFRSIPASQVKVSGERVVVASQEGGSLVAYVKAPRPLRVVVEAKRGVVFEGKVQTSIAVRDGRVQETQLGPLHQLLAVAATPPASFEAVRESPAIGELRQRLVRHVSPPALESMRFQTREIVLKVNAQGTVVHLQPVGLGNIPDEVLNAIRRWRFVPAVGGAEESVVLPLVFDKNGRLLTPITPGVREIE